MTNVAAHGIIERTEKDKYGRTVRHLSTEPFRTKVVIVRMPKGYIERYGKAQSYLVNDWQHPAWIDGVSQGEEQGKLVNAPTLAAARAIAVGKIASPHPLSER